MLLLVTEKDAALSKNGKKMCVFCILVNDEGGTGLCTLFNT